MGRDQHATHGNEDRALSARRSPRTCVRKVKCQKKDAEVPNRTEPRPSRKRKVVSYEDDPSYIEDEETDAFTEQQKKVPGYRCSPHLVPEVMEKLSPKQRGWVHNIGFDALQQMIGSRCLKSLTMWLVDQVDIENGTLCVCGEPVDIRVSVKRILNLPHGQHKVPLPLNGRSKAKIPRDGNSRHDDKHTYHGRGQSAKDAIKVLLAENEDEVSFCQSFVMLLLCIYLAPTTTLNINRSYYPALMDVSQISLLDWCGFIADYLINGIEEFRRSKSSHIQVPGCVHLLPLIYIDSLIKHKALLLPEALSLPPGEPRIHFIRSEHLAFLASADLSPKSKDHIQYGFLQENYFKSFKKGHKQSSFVTPSASYGIPAAVNGAFHNSGTSDITKTNMSLMLESLFKEIKDGREKLVQEFHLKIVNAECANFDRFKKQFLANFSYSEQATPADSVFHQTAPSSHTPPVAAGCTEDGKNPNMSAQEDTPIFKGVDRAAISEVAVDADLTPVAAGCTDDGKNPNMSAEEDTPIFKGVDRAAMLEVPVDADLTRPRSSIAPGCSDGTSIMKQRTNPVVCHPPVASGANLENNIAGMHGVAMQGVGVDLSSSRFGSAEPQLDPTSHSVDVDRPSQHDGNASPFVDELAEVVEIGKQAATEATCIDSAVTGHVDDGVRLYILSEAAMSEGPPMFDASPAVRAVRFHPTTCVVPSVSVDCNMNASSSNVDHSMDVSMLKSPVFDKSPAIPSNKSVLQTRKASDLQTISETAIDLAHAEEMSLPECLLRAEYSTKSPAVNLSVEDAEINIFCSNSAGKQICDTADTESTDGYPECSPYGSRRSEIDDCSESTDIPATMDDDVSHDDDPLQTTPDFILTPSYTYDTQEIVVVPDLPSSPVPRDILHIPPLQKEIESGYRFKFGSSISVSTGKSYSRYNSMGNIDPGKKDQRRFSFILCAEASETYKVHVSNSKARLPKRNVQDKYNAERVRTKIQIKRFHISKGDFVDAMEPQGEVCQTLMGLCSVAIMLDWGTTKRVILDQAILRELMRPGHECNDLSVAARLRKLPLADIEEIFLPMLTHNHWILAVVNVISKKVDLYDSLLVVTDGDHPHRKFWDNVAGNLEHAFSTAKHRTVTISYFPCKYPKTKIQTNSHDCGFHVIQTMECYGTPDILGQAKKITLLPYRKYLSHVLVYHRFNDLNPMREGLRYEEP